MSEYQLAPDGIYVPRTPVAHRDDEYDPIGFDTLWQMQTRHFWYRGRHRFLLRALDRFMPRSGEPLSAIDLGGGVGGWVHYLAQHRGDRFGRIALADSSVRALSMAADILPAGTQRYQVDLMRLGWKEQWDVTFLLDVIEHLPDDVGAVREAAQALRPGGVLLVTTPALMQFWSYNDEAIHHLRRYSRAQFGELAQQTGLTLLDARYFMFFLSPLYFLSRITFGARKLSHEQRQVLVHQQHQIPSAPINGALTAIFAAETPLGHWVRFPWGTSILGVFVK